MIQIDRRVSWLLLGAVILTTSGFSIRHYDGHDFIHNVWAPTHGLLAGFNPYDPLQSEYLRQYNLPIMAGLYTPTSLLLHAPIALLSPARSADVMALLNVSLIWLGVLLLIPPIGARSSIVAAGCGALLLLSAPAQHTIELGQLSAWAFAGFALLVTSLRKETGSTWLPTIGIALIALKPQYAIPTFVALAALGYWQLAGRAAAILAITSLPGILLFLFRAPDWSAIVRTVTENVSLLSRLPPGNLANPSNLRIDALGVLSHLFGSALTGPGWTLLAFSVLSLLLILAVRGDRESPPSSLANPYLATLIGLYITVALYHLTYDQLLLYVGPLASINLALQGRRMNTPSKIIAVGGAALLVVGLLLRSGVRARMINLGISQELLHVAWVTLPTLMSVLVIGIAFFFAGKFGSRERSALQLAPSN